MEGDCWFVLALKLSWQTVWPNLTALLYDTSLLPAWDNILVRTATLMGDNYHGNYSQSSLFTKLNISLGCRAPLCKASSPTLARLKRIINFLFVKN